MTTRYPPPPHTNLSLPCSAARLSSFSHPRCLGQLALRQILCRAHRLPANHLHFPLRQWVPPRSVHLPPLVPQMVALLEVQMYIHGGDPSITVTSSAGNIKLQLAIGNEPWALGQSCPELYKLSPWNLFQGGGVSSSDIWIFK